MNRQTRKRRTGTERLKNDPEYILVKELGFEEMVPFVLENIRKRGWMSFLYIASCSALFLWMVFQVWWILSGDQLGGKQVVGQLILGIVAGSFLVIPVHEVLHGLAYKLVGAKKIIFGSDLKQFIFFVTADRFPVSGPAIIFLALFPFAVINAVTWMMLITWFPDKMIFCGFFLLSHNIMCIGDFAICNYVRLTGGQVYSYDVPEKKMSYFYQRRKDY